MRRRIVSKASKTSSSSLARSSRTLLSTAMSGLFLTASPIDELHPPLEQSLAFLVAQVIGDRACFLGQSGAEGNLFRDAASLFHGHRLVGNVVGVKPRSHVA